MTDSLTEKLIKKEAKKESEYLEYDVKTQKKKLSMAFSGYLGNQEEDEDLTLFLEDTRITNIMHGRIMLIDKALIAFALMSITLSMIEVRLIFIFLAHFIV